MPKFGPEFWVRLKHPNSRINQYQPGMNLYQIGMNLYQIGMNLYQIGINSYRFRFSYTVFSINYNHGSREIQSDMDCLLSPSEKHDEGYDE